MRGYFGGGAQWPRLDLVMLGMGDDGHTASLFPGSAALGETGAWVVANWVEKFNTWRITLSAPAINNARHVVFLITGERDTTRLPSQMIAPRDGTLAWLVDRAAASKLGDA